jgi:hypothetical protein
MFRKLSFPPTELKLQRKVRKILVFCLIRKRWLNLTPEEWVRQHVVGYLIQICHIPAGRIALEKSFQYQDRNKRWDIVCYDDQGQAELLVECKAPEVGLTTETLYQISAYQRVIQARKLIITNGIECFVLDGSTWCQGIASI